MTVGTCKKCGRITAGKLGIDLPIVCENCGYNHQTAEVSPSNSSGLVMPIMIDVGTDWDRTVPFAMLNEKWAKRNHGQTLKELAGRGGIGPCEALAIMDKRRWKAMDLLPSIEELTQRIDAEN